MLLAVVLRVAVIIMKEMVFPNGRENNNYIMARLMIVVMEERMVMVENEVTVVEIVVMVIGVSGSGYSCN